MAITRFKNSTIGNKTPKYNDVLAGLPFRPIIGTATDGGNGTSVSVAFTGNNPAGAGITYTALSSPGNITATGPASPITVTGLTSGTAYTFQVKAGNSLGDSAYSAASNSVTPITPDNFFILTEYGQVYASADTTSWTYKATPTYTSSTVIEYYGASEANGKLYLQGGTPFELVESTNGTTWSISQTANTFARPMIYTGSAYMSKYKSLTGYSTNGTSWRFNYTPLEINDFGGGDVTIAYGNGIFVTVGEGFGATPRIATSTDNVTWTTRTHPHTDPDYYAVAYGDSKFVITGGEDADGKAIIATSTDGITWTSRTPSTGSTAARSMTQLTYGNGKFVAVTDNYGIQYSTDGITWTGVAVSDAAIYSMTYGDGKYAGNGVVASTGVQKIYYSTDAVTWSNASWNPSNLDYFGDGLTYFSGDGKWYIALAGAVKSYAYSTNLTTWAYGEITDTVINSALAINYNSSGSLYTLASSGGRIYTSTNTSSWTARTSGTTVNLRDIGYFNNQYIVAGNSGFLATSTDAITWTSRTSGFGTTTILSIAYGASTYVIGGSAGRISTSTDGVTWTSRTSNFGTSAVNKIRYLSSTFVAVGAGGTIRTSTDAVTWTTRTSNLTTALNDVRYLNNLYIAAGDSGNIVTSTDAVTWTSRTVAIARRARTIMYGGGNYVIPVDPSSSDGSGGTTPTLVRAQVSTDGTTWTSRLLDSISPRMVVTSSVTL